MDALFLKVKAAFISLLGDEYNPDTVNYQICLILDMGQGQQVEIEASLYGTNRIHLFAPPPEVTSGSNQSHLYRISDSGKYVLTLKGDSDQVIKDGILIAERALWILEHCERNTQPCSENL